MRPRISKPSYRDHKYSGRKSNPKSVLGQLKRHHLNKVSRLDIWRSKVSKPKQCTNTKPKQYTNTKLKQSTNTNIPSSDATPSNENICTRRLSVESETECQKQNITLLQSTSSEIASEVSIAINWPVIDPTPNSHQLTIESEQRNNLQNLTGLRLVDIQHVLHWAFDLEKHKANCPGSTIEFLNETRNGFDSIFTFKCSMCDQEFRESSKSEQN